MMSKVDKRDIVFMQLSQTEIFNPVVLKRRCCGCKAKQAVISLINTGNVRSLTNEHSLNSGNDRDAGGCTQMPM